MKAQRLPSLTALTDACERFVEKELTVQLQSGWGWSRTLNGVHEPFFDDKGVSSRKIKVCIKRFFRGEDGRIRGFTGWVVPTGHELDRFNAVLFTMSDGVDFDFGNNICMAWGAWFGDHDPTDLPGSIPEFTTGNGYKGYGTVYEDETAYRDYRLRLQLLDPRKSRT